MEHHKIKVEKTAHYFTQGEVSEKVEYFWFVAHGMGQLASNIIRKFEQFDKDTHLVVAPEALNRFYWNLKQGVVGANWMTKQDRLDDIGDYTEYLTTIFEHYEQQLPKNVKIILLGFSQGCATQVRWIMNRFPNFHHLILWAGMFPEDLDYQPFKTYFMDKNLHFLCGDKDEFINDEKLNWHSDFTKEQGLDVHFTPFIGKHEIPTDLLGEYFTTHIFKKG
jgi:predicted esterase